MSERTELTLVAPASNALEGELVSTDGDSLAILHETKPLQSADIAGTVIREHTGAGRRTYESRLNQAAEAWGFLLEVDERGTLRERQAILRQRYRMVPWHKVRAWHVKALKARLIEAGKSYNTINLTLAAVKAVCKHTFLINMMSGDDFVRIKLVEPVRGHREPVGRDVNQGEIYAIVNACSRDPSPAGARDTAVLALLYACGMRRREVAELKVENLRREEDLIQFLGKKNRERKTFPTDSVWGAIDAWLAVRGAHDGRLFCRIKKGGHISPFSKLTEQAIYNIVVKRITEAALKRKATPHDLRRSFATELLRKDQDLKTVSTLMGHASVDTTAVYDLRDDQARRKAQQEIHWPTISSPSPTDSRSDR